jgi:hypothetical protein
LSNNCRKIGSKILFEFLRIGKGSGGEEEEKEEQEHKQEQEDWWLKKTLYFRFQDGNN